MKLPIDKNVPMPERKIKAKKNGERLASFPLADLEVNDSFFIPGGGRDQGEACHSWAAIYGVKLATRTVTEKGVTGLRVWRTR